MKKVHGIIVEKYAYQKAQKEKTAAKEKLKATKDKKNQDGDGDAGNPQLEATTVAE